MPFLPTVLIGYKREERDRQERTCASYKAAIPGSIVDYPLCWGNDYRDLSLICRNDLGIEPPRVYDMGFDYNNCGTSCCKGGIGSRVLEAIRFPDRFERDMSWEEKMRAKAGSLEGKSFCARVVDG
ncbi:MAG: hypothetical protein JO202_16710, partial [Ktedonobacteraceae bacterium]|nr:hypothetical protein [Ktedonobacteraceae bacterium]